MKKLKAAERACNIVAFLCGLLMLLAISGGNTNGAAVAAMLAVMFLLIFVASRLRKRSNAILRREHEKLPINAEKAAVVAAEWSVLVRRCIM